MTATTGGMDELALPDLARRQANTLRVGTVMAVDPANNLLRVKSGNIETDWIRWGVRRAKGTRTWSALEVGEQVLLGCPSGDLRQAVVLCAIPQDAAPPAGDTAEIERTEYPDGTVAEYDHGAHRLLWNLGPTIITADRSSLVLECNGSKIIMDAAGIRLIGARIDLN